MDLESADVDGESDTELAFVDEDIKQPPSSICDTREEHLNKVLPELTIDMSDSYAVEGKIKERISNQQRKQFSLDSERLEKIFDAISFRRFPVRNESIREDLDILPAVVAFRKRLDFAIEQMAAQLLSIKNSEVRHLAINSSLYAFTVANADAKSRNLLIQIFTDPRLMPYVTQMALGTQNISPQIIERLPSLDPLDYTECLGVYFITIKSENSTLANQRDMCQELSESMIYTGSAISDHRFASRIRQHEVSAQLVWHESRRCWGLPGKPLRVHRLMAHPESSYCYRWLYQVPVIDDPELRPLLRMCVALLECIFISEGSLSTHIRGFGSELRHLSLVLSSRLQLNHTPLFNGWQGLNAISPLFQRTNPGFNEKVTVGPKNIIWQHLIEYYEQHRELYLSRDAAEKIATQLRHSLDSLHLSTTVLRHLYVRGLYYRILSSYGHKLGSYCMLPDDPERALVLAAVIQQSHEHGLIIGPTSDGNYALLEGLIDWERIRNRVLRLAPTVDFSLLTPAKIECIFRYYTKSTDIDRYNLFDAFMAGENLEKVLGKSCFLLMYGLG